MPQRFYEESLNIKSSGNVILYGFLSRSKVKTNSLIIFVHGLLESADDHLFFNSSHFFAEKGFDTYRYNLYGFQKNTRKLDEDFNVYSRDLEEIITTFGKKYKKIYLVSHSLGSYTSLLIHTKCNGIILWEPSLHPKTIADNMLKNVRSYIDIGYNVVLSKKLLESFKTVPQSKILLKNLDTEVSVIVSSLNRDIGIKFEGCVNKIVLIKNASHSFDTNQTEKILFTKTYSLIRSLEAG